jgi:small basic protein
MMMLWAWAGVPLGVYNIVQNFNIALQIQPQVLTFLSLATWIQVYHHERQWSVMRSLAVVLPVATIMAGIQVGLIYALHVGESHQTTWPVKLMAVLAALLLALGVLRHYYDIYVHRTVRGISFIFCGIDALGDLTSLISVFFQPSLDVFGIVIYATELALWLGIFACGGYYNLRPWMLARSSARNFAQTEHEVNTPQRHDPEGPVPGAIALHQLSSSTSVFRTSSASMDTTRSRAQNASGQPAGQ